MTALICTWLFSYFACSYLGEVIKAIGFISDRHVDHSLSLLEKVSFNILKGKGIAGISEEALAILMRHDFPGNIRELGNIIEHTFILARAA